MKLTPTNQFVSGRSDAPPERLRLLGFATVMLLAGVGLGVVAGPPRVPDAPPRLDQLAATLSGSRLPLQPVSLLLLDLAWVLWLWIVGSLVLEVGVVAAESAAQGAAWVTSLRRLADRVTFPLARRAVAAAFAVQVLSRGVPLAAAQPLPPAETGLMAEASGQSLPFAILAASEAESDPAEGSYLVRPGDTLWSIAEQAYGTGTAYRRLVDANLGRRMPDGLVFAAQGVIKPGWALVVPEPRLGVAVEELDGQRWYTVRPGDTLSSVAAALFGDDSRWPELFELNRGTASRDATHVLTNPNVIWPGLRLRLPSVEQTPVDEAEVAPSDLVAASAAQSSTPSASSVEGSIAEPSMVLPPEEVEPLPLTRTLHALDPIALEPSDVAEPAPDETATDPVSSPSDAQATLPAPPRPGELATSPIAFGGLGLIALAGVAFGARRMRRLRPLQLEPESEVVVEGGFAEAQLAHEFTRGLHAAGFDPVAAIVDQLRAFLEEYNLGHVGLVSLSHGRSATTLTLAAGLAELPILVDLAPVFAARLDAEAEAWVSADQDVVVRLVRVRKTRLLPSADAQPEDACLVPLGVLYDRQMYVATCSSLGHVLIASVPGHGADTILTSLVATLTARRSPEKLRLWMIARPRALAAPVFELPHLVRTTDPADEPAVLLAAEDLRAELDRRAQQGPGADLVVVIPELSSLGDHAASFELLANRSASLGVRFIAATTCPDEAALSPLLGHFGTRMVLRMQTEDASVALLGVADAAFLGGGGRLLLRLDGREPVELYGYHVAPEHLERLVRVMRSAYPSGSGLPPEPPPPSAPPPPVAEEPAAWAQALESEVSPQPTPASSPVVDAASAPAEPVLATTPPIQVLCFGGTRVMCAGQQVWPRRTGGDAKPWEFLLYLACQPAAGVSSDDAVEALWPEDEDAANPGHRFRQLRYRLRHALATVSGAPETDGISLERGTLRLDPSVVYSDAQEFLEACRQARIDPGPGATQPLERARELYQGDLLEGPDTRRYAWVDERDGSGVTLREHFRRLFQHASNRLAEMYAAGGELEAAVDVYRELTEIDPFDERLWLALFRLHAERGDRLALVREEHRFRSTLRDLAAETAAAESEQIDDPSREVLQEYQRLLAGLKDPEPQAAAV